MSEGALPVRPFVPSCWPVPAGGCLFLLVFLASLMAKGTHQEANCAVACRRCTSPPAASHYTGCGGALHETAIEPARRAAGTGCGLCLGHQFRGDPAGAECAAAAVLRHPAVYLRAAAGVLSAAQ